MGGMALAAEQAMGPMKKVEDLFASTSMTFDMAFKYDKEQFEKAPDAQPAKTFYDQMMGGITSQFPPDFEKPEGLESIAGLKTIEIDMDGDDGKWALDFTFEHLDLEKFLTEVTNRLEAE